MWYSEEYQFPVKIINHIDGSKDSGFELKDVELWSADKSSFSIPDDYRIMEPPGSEILPSASQRETVLENVVQNRGKIIEGAPAVQDAGINVSRLIDLRFTSPEGGEIWEKGRTYTIRWDKTDGTGNVNCAYDDTSTISWYLVKRTKECEPVITYLKGDVKINGKPAEQGGKGIEEGEIIETGSHSRMEIQTGNNEAIRLGSKSQLKWHDPCKPRKPLSDKEAYLSGMRLLKGNAYGVVSRILGKNSDFEVTCGTATVGVRGQFIQAPQTLYASIDPYFIQEEIDPEKAELIEGYQYLSDNQTAFYIHFEDDVVKSVSNLKGEVRIKEAKGFRQIDLPEGTSVSQWEDGTPMTEILILTR